MQERISIENFGGIEKADIALNKINLFIGPQASGKSIIVKLLYFFKKIPQTQLNQALLEYESWAGFIKRLETDFYNYFPTSTYPSSSFKITYSSGSYSYSVEKKNTTNVHILTDQKFKKDFNDLKKLAVKDILDINESYNSKYQKELKARIFNKVSVNNIQSITNSQLFIPAGRSFFANLQSNIFTFLSSSNAIDPFLKEFGSFYESYKNYHAVINYRSKFIDTLISKLLKGNYVREKDKDSLIHPDGRKINIAYSSSGQQEVLPLTLVLKAVLSLNSKFSIYIEEPEAHLYPTAQKNIVELIATVKNINAMDSQFFITTHSPYILTSFNNLIQAGQIASENESDNDFLVKLEGIVPRNQLLYAKDIAAYVVINGQITDLVDQETGLIDASIIDQVSTDIAIQFDQLLDLQ